MACFVIAAPIDVREKSAKHANSMRIAISQEDGGNTDVALV
jgi:hypothetical protein